MQSTVSSLGGKLFIRAAISVVLCVLVYLSLGFIFTAMGTETIGYTMYQKQADGSMVSLGDYYYSDLDELKEQAATGQEETSVDEETGETVTYFRQSIRSDMPTFLKVISFILSEICMLGIYVSMLYITAWEAGQKDGNAHGKNAKCDPKMGLKAGLYASIPLAAAWAVLLVSKCSGMFPNFAGTFKMLLFPWFPIVGTMIPVAATAEMPWWALLTVLPLMSLKPLTAHLAYTLGQKGVVLRDRILYKSNKPKKHKKAR